MYPPTISHRKARAVLEAKLKFREVEEDWREKIKLSVSGFRGLNVPANQALCIVDKPHSTRSAAQHRD